MLRAGESWHTRLGVVAVTHDDGVERLVRVRRAIRLAARRARGGGRTAFADALFAVFPRRFFFFFFPRRLDGLGHDAPPRPPLLQVRALVLVRRARGSQSGVLGVLGRRRHGDDARPQPDALSDVVVVGVRVQVRAHLLVPAETPVVVRERAREREAAEPHHLAGQVRAQVLVHAAVHSLRAVRVRARQVILHVRVVHPHAPELGALLEDHRVVALARELGARRRGRRRPRRSRRRARVGAGRRRSGSPPRPWTPSRARTARARAPAANEGRGARRRRASVALLEAERGADRNGRGDWRKAHVRSPTSMRRAPPAVTSASQREFPADHEIFSTSPRVHCRRDVVAPAHFEMHAASRAVSGTFASPSRAFHASRGPPPARASPPAPPPARATSRARSSPRTSDP